MTDITTTPETAAPSRNGSAAQSTPSSQSALATASGSASRIPAGLSRAADGYWSIYRSLNARDPDLGSHVLGVLFPALVSTATAVGLGCSVPEQAMIATVPAAYHAYSLVKGMGLLPWGPDFEAVPSDWNDSGRSDSEWGERQQRVLNAAAATAAASTAATVLTCVGSPYAPIPAIASEVAVSLWLALYPLGERREGSEKAQTMMDENGREGLAEKEKPKED